MATKRSKVLIKCRYRWRTETSTNDRFTAFAFHHAEAECPLRSNCVCIDCGFGLFPVYFKLFYNITCPIHGKRFLLTNTRKNKSGRFRVLLFWYYFSTLSHGSGWRKHWANEKCYPWNHPRTSMKVSGQVEGYKPISGKMSVVSYLKLSITRRSGHIIALSISIAKIQVRIYFVNYVSRALDSLWLIDTIGDINRILTWVGGEARKQAFFPCCQNQHWTCDFSSCSTLRIIHHLFSIPMASDDNKLDAKVFSFRAVLQSWFVLSKLIPRLAQSLRKRWHTLI